MVNYIPIATYTKQQFHVVVEIADEYLDADSSLTDKVAKCEVEWFMLRVQVYAKQVLLSSTFRGSLLYDNAMTVLTDGTAQELIEFAVIKAEHKLMQLQSL